MRRFAPAIGRPRLSLPVGEVCGRFLRHAFPPHVAVVGERDVREDHVRAERVHRVRIRLVRCPGRDAEISCFRIDRMEIAVRSRLDPRDVVADRRHLPAFESARRNQHREVGLAARARKCRAYVALFSLRRRHAEDQHVLGKPSLVASHHRSDAQRQAFLAEQRVAAIARAKAPYLARLGKMDDVLVIAIAWPRRVARARREWRADRVHAGNERAVLVQHIEHGAAHSRHDPHARRDIGTVGQLNADVRDRTAERSHRKRHDVQRASAHRAVEQAAERPPHLVGRHPVVRRAGVVFALAANERAILDARDVARIRQREIAVRPLGRIQPDQRPLLDHLRAQPVVLGFAAVAPRDRFGLGERGELAHPAEQARMAHIAWRADGRG